MVTINLFSTTEKRRQNKTNTEAKTETRLSDEECKRQFKAEWKGQIEEFEKDINEWESNDIDNEEKEEEKLLETATQYYNNYGEEDFSCSSSEPGTEFENNSNLSSASE